MAQNFCTHIQAGILWADVAGQLVSHFAHLISQLSHHVCVMSYIDGDRSCASDFLEKNISMHSNCRDVACIRKVLCKARSDVSSAVRCPQQFGQLFCACL